MLLSEHEKNSVHEHYIYLFWSVGLYIFLCSFPIRPLACLPTGHLSIRLASAHMPILDTRTLIDIFTASNVLPAVWYYMSLDTFWGCMIASTVTLYLQRKHIHCCMNLTCTWIGRQWTMQQKLWWCYNGSVYVSYASVRKLIILIFS